MKTLAYVGAGIVALAVAGALIGEPRGERAKVPNVVAAEPDEPCVVEADNPAGRAAAQNWCEGGVFTQVSLKSSGTTMTALLQFSKKGFAGWNGNRAGIINGFRRMTADISSNADMNVAVSLHDPAGTMVGGCVQKRSEREPTCTP